MVFWGLSGIPFLIFINIVLRWSTNFTGQNLWTEVMQVFTVILINTIAPKEKIQKYCLLNYTDYCIILTHKYWTEYFFLMWLCNYEIVFSINPLNMSSSYRIDVYSNSYSFPYDYMRVNIKLCLNKKKAKARRSSSLPFLFF